jgi:general secretion pathway protein G
MIRLAHTTAPDHRTSGGFTLLELMVVLLVLALLATIAAPRVAKYLSRAKTDTAKVQVEALSSAVDSFHLDMGRYPTTQEGLKALIDPPSNAGSWDGPYVRKRQSLTDPWGHAYEYRFPGKHGDYDVYSVGASQATSSKDDANALGNW